MEIISNPSIFISPRPTLWFETIRVFVLIFRSDAWYSGVFWLFYCRILIFKPKNTDFGRV